MNRFYKNIGSFLQEARLAISNAQNVPEIAEPIALFGFDAAMIQVGADLLAQGEALQAAQVQKYSEQYIATRTRDKARYAVDKSYSVHRQLVRLALKSEPETQKALLVHERKKRTLSGGMAQVKVFYTNLLANESVKAALVKYKITEEKLIEAQAAVAQVEALEAAQKQVRSEALQATKERDAALDALDKWLAELRQVARIALAHNPQLLQALGFS